MRKRMPIFAANWKMYKTFGDTAKFIDEFKANFKAFDKNKVEAVICPPFTSLFKAAEKLAQNNINNIADIADALLENYRL
jgi:triosephosphate isomerase